MTNIIGLPSLTLPITPLYTEREVWESRRDFIGSFVLFLRTTSYKCTAASRSGRVQWGGLCVCFTDNEETLLFPCNSTEARWISESDPWKQAVIPHSYPKSTARQHDSMGQGTDLLCGEIGLWIHERVLIQPLPNDPTEFAMTQGRKRLVATTEGERDEGRRQGNGTSECFSVQA